MALTEMKRGDIGEDAPDPMPALSAEWQSTGPKDPVHRRALLVQFMQFCLVGALSTVLNEVLFNLFLAHKLGVNLSYILAFCIAVSNGFFLNRGWTFRRSRSSKMERQYTMFFAVNIVGLCLSWAVMRVVGAWLLHTGWAQSLAPMLQNWVHRPVRPDSLAYSLGVLAATPPCAVWNFSANRLWTFGGARRHG